MKFTKKKKAIYIDSRGERVSTTLEFLQRLAIKGTLHENATIEIDGVVRKAIEIDGLKEFFALDVLKEAGVETATAPSSDKEKEQETRIDKEPIQQLRKILAKEKLQKLVGPITILVSVCFVLGTCVSDCRKKNEAVQKAIAEREKSEREMRRLFADRTNEDDAQPEPLNVWLDLETNEVDASPTFRFTSNLPDRTKVMAAIVKKVRAANEGFVAQNSAFVDGGAFEFSFFDGAKMENGEYILEVTTPIIQEPEVLRRIGENGEFYAGPLAVDKTVFGSGKRVIQGNFPFEITDGISREAVEAEEAKINSLVESTRSNARRLYQELLDFKGDADFIKYGLDVAGPYNNWSQEVQSLRNALPQGAPRTPQEVERFKVSVALGEIEQLGLEYANNGGRETETTRRLRSKIESDLN